MIVEKQSLPLIAWSVGLVSAAMLFSFALACGMPFAGLGALAAVVLPLRQALATATLGWLANQIVGFGFLGYPADPATIAWGVALGLSAIAAVAAAKTVYRLSARWPSSTRAVFAFAAALVAQQAVVYAASWPLPSHPSAFSLPVLAEIGWTNALAFMVLGLLYRLGTMTGLAPLPRQAHG
ncbi:MAG: hypothetical protein AAF724_21260 [Pseudomonadota bacterium]